MLKTFLLLLVSHFHSRWIRMNHESWIESFISFRTSCLWSKLLKDFIHKCYWNCTLNFSPSLFLTFLLSAWILSMLSSSGFVRPEVSSNLCLYVYIFNLYLIYGGLEVLYIGAAGSSVCDCVPVRGWTLDLSIVSCILYFLFPLFPFGWFFFFGFFFSIGNSLYGEG